MSYRSFGRSLTTRHGLLTAFIFVLSLPPAVTALAQCLGALYTQIICSKAPGQDGKKHVRISFEDSDNLNVHSAPRSMTNRFSGTTGVVFELAEWGRRTETCTSASRPSRPRRKAASPTSPTMPAFTGA